VRESLCGKARYRVAESHRIEHTPHRFLAATAAGAHYREWEETGDKTGMNEGLRNAEGASVDSSGRARLDSWKRIAAYLKRDVTTVQRWERREGMPVHRHKHEKQGSVYAYPAELDAWWVRLKPTQPAEEMAAPVPLERRNKGVNAVLAALVAALLIGGAIWFASHAGYFWRDPLRDAKITPLTNFSGKEQAAAISRDGRFVAFLGERDGQLDAWLTQIGTNRYRNLTEGKISQLSNPSIRSVAFSPDGTLVSIWTRSGDGSRPENFQLLGAPISGGPLKLYMPEAAEAAWSPDGTRLVFHITAPGDPMFVRAAAEESAHQIYVASPGVHCHFPTWSPDGEFIYFVRGEPPAHWDVWRMRPSGEGLERITFHNARVSHPVLIDSRTLLYLASDSDSSGPWLYAMDLSRRHTQRVGIGLEKYTSLAASANGMRLVATVSNSLSELWRANIGDAGSPQRTPVPVSVAQNASAPRFGSDYFTFVASGGGRREVWKVANGTATELWHDLDAARIGAPAIAPDGKRIAFTVDRHAATQLYVMDSDGSHAGVVAAPPSLRGDIAWSPDSQSIIGAVLFNGEPRLAKISLNGTPPRPMVSEYSLGPAWSPDGKYLVYSGADVGTTFPLRAVGSDGRPYGMPTLILTRGARRVVFSQKSGSLIVLRGELGHKNFWIVNPVSGAERQLTDLPANFEVGDFDVSPDETEIMFDRVVESSSLALIDRTL
jgi:Tol biopolymer transport system component